MSTKKAKKVEIQSGVLLRPTCGQGDLSTDETYVVLDVTQKVTPTTGLKEETMFMLLGTIDEAQRIIPRIVEYTPKYFTIVGRVDNHFDCEPKQW